MFDVGTRLVADSEHLLAMAQSERVSALGDLHADRPATFLPGTRPNIKRGALVTNTIII